MNASELRSAFMNEGLNRESLMSDPYKQFENWYSVTRNSDIPEPTAMSLATVDEHGQPWQRMVLLKLYDTNGFVFFTNLSSRKAEQIEHNNKVSLLFPWHALGRQVKVTGLAEKISTVEAAKYFATRARGSQIGAWASPQSQIIKTRSILDTMFTEMKTKFKQGEVPLPDFWGGYRVKADTIEFWQARDNRFHDCFIFKKNASSNWSIDRLAP